MILVDTSAWIEVLRGRQPGGFSRYSASEEIVTCLPVVQEILQGFPEGPVQRFVRFTLNDVFTIEEPLTRPVFEEAAHLFTASRKAGLTVRSGFDCLIAACALRNDATVLHLDRDFDKLAQVSKLRVLRLDSTALTCPSAGNAVAASLE